MSWFALVSWMAVMLPMLGSDPGSQQRPTDFSGTWSLVEFRIGNEPATGQSEIIGGAPINCGRRCTILQSREMLKVSRVPDESRRTTARTAVSSTEMPKVSPVPDKSGAKPREEVVYLDNRPVPGVTMNAKWDGQRLVLGRTFVSINVIQTLSIEKERLVVDVAVGGSRVGPYRLTYERK